MTHKWNDIKHKKNAPKDTKGSFKTRLNCDPPPSAGITLTVPHCNDTTDPASITFHSAFVALFRYIHERGGVARFREYVQELGRTSVGHKIEEAYWVNQAKTLNLADWYSSIDWVKEDPQNYQAQLECLISVRQAWWT